MYIYILTFRNFFTVVELVGGGSVINGAYPVYFLTNVVITG